MVTTLYQDNGSVLTSKSISSLYSRSFDSIKKIVEGVHVEGSQFYAKEMGNLETRKIGEVFSALDLPIKATDTDRVPLFQPLEGHNKTVTAVQRRAGIMVTKDAVNAQKTRMIAQLLVGLPTSVKQLYEYAFAAPWNGGTDTYTTGDGAYLFAADHTYEDARAGAWSNVETSAAFTTDSLFAAWLNMQLRKTSKGFPKPQQISTIFYPVDLQEAVSKVHNSSMYPQNSLNAEMDPLFSNWKMQPSIYLRDGSSTAWYIVGSNDEADRGLVHYEQVAPDYESISDSMNPRLIFGKSVTVSFVTDCVHGRNIARNAGA